MFKRLKHFIILFNILGSLLAFTNRYTLMQTNNHNDYVPQIVNHSEVDFLRLIEKPGLHIPGFSIFQSNL